MRHVYVSWAHYRVVKKMANTFVKVGKGRIRTEADVLRAILGEHLSSSYDDPRAKYRISWRAQNWTIPPIVSPSRSTRRQLVESFVRLLSDLTNVFPSRHAYTALLCRLYNAANHNLCIAPDFTANMDAWKQTNKNKKTSNNRSVTSRRALT